MVSIQISNLNTQEQNYKNPSSGSIIGGVVVGSAVGNFTTLPHKLFAPKIMKKVKTISASLKADEFNQVEKAIANTMKQSGLDKKGVEIIKATAKNSKKINAIIGKEINNSVLRFLPKKIKELVGAMFSSQLAAGRNACYTFASKKIVLPEKGLELAFFHEAGHAMNANLSKFGKLLQKCRPMIMLTLPITLISLFKTKKAPGEEPTTKLDKATTFIKNNAGKLTFATFVPLLLEEGLATLKGNNFAKKLLSPELAKKVAKTNALGFSTYAMLATLSGLGVYFGTKVKDAIASRKLVTENKQ